MATSGGAGGRLGRPRSAGTRWLSPACWPSSGRGLDRPRRGRPLRPHRLRPGDVDRTGRRRRRPRGDRRADIRRCDGFGPDRRPWGDPDRLCGADRRPADRDVGRHGAPQHPAHRGGQAPGPECLQHGHDDRGQHRPRDQAGRHVQSAARYGRCAVAAGVARLWFLRRGLPAKINSLWSRARGQSNLFPGSKSRERGFNALKGALGELYQIDIPYYIEVDFNGFKKIVDTFGGVAIDVQTPVSDDHYPIGAGNSYNLYIPSGFQHMDGTEALAYARARHRPPTSIGRSASSVSSPRSASRSTRPACSSPAGSRHSSRRSSHRSTRTSPPSSSRPSSRSPARSMPRRSARSSSHRRRTRSSVSRATR